MLPATTVPSTGRIVKVVIVGAPKTGKSSLMRSYDYLDFDPSYSPTTTGDFTAKTVEIGSVEISYQIWDVGGSGLLGRSFLRGTNGMILVADLTSKASFKSLDSTYENVKRLIGFADDSFPCVVVVNKLDLVVGSNNSASMRQLSLDSVQKWATTRRGEKDSPIQIFEVSAKDRTNVTQMFESMLRMALKNPGRILPPELENISTEYSYNHGGENWVQEQYVSPLSANGVRSSLPGTRTVTGTGGEAESDDISTPYGNNHGGENWVQDKYISPYGGSPTATGNVSRGEENKEREKNQDQQFRLQQAKIDEISPKSITESDTESKPQSSRNFDSYEEECSVAKPERSEAESDPYDENDDEQAIAKVVIAGAASVGKTFILKRFVNDDKGLKNRKYEPTVGADLKIVDMPVKDRTLTLQIWDTSGNPKMLSMGRSIYR